MVQWIKDRPLPVLFLASMLLGLLLLCAGLFTISATVGLVGSGILVLATGHWVTYLTSVRGGTR